MDEPDLPYAVPTKAAELADAAHSYLRTVARTPWTVAAALVGVAAGTSLIWAPATAWNVPWTLTALALIGLGLLWHGRMTGSRATSWKRLLGVARLIGLDTGSSRSGQAPSTWARCLADAAETTQGLTAVRPWAVAPAQPGEDGERVLCPHTAYFASQADATTVLTVLVLHGLSVHCAADGEGWVVHAAALVPTVRIAEHYHGLSVLVRDRGGVYKKAGLPLKDVPEEHV